MTVLYPTWCTHPFGSDANRISVDIESAMEPDGVRQLRHHYDSSLWSYWRLCGGRWCGGVCVCVCGGGYEVRARWSRTVYGNFDIIMTHPCGALGGAVLCCGGRWEVGVWWEVVGRWWGVRQLRHHFRPFLARFSAPTTPTRAVCCALRSAYADRVVIGAWDPML